MNNISDTIAQELVKELKIRKRWSRFFKLLFFVWLFFMLYLAYTEKKPTDFASSHTAIIKLEGGISESGDNSSDYLATSLNKAFESKNAKGIILRINSPGGSPVTADYIFNEIRRLKEKFPKKKIYAVCTEVCASAAYYIAAAADEIFANPASLVGSISVLYDGFGYVGTMEKLGIERRMFTSGKNKGYLDPFSPLVPEQVDGLKEMLNTLHDQFVEDVKLGRQDKLSDNPDVFSGLYWTGVRAKELGLIDGFSSSGTVAREMVQESRIIDYTYRPNYLDKIAEQMHLSGKILNRIWSVFTDLN